MNRAISPRAFLACTTTCRKPFISCGKVSISGFGAGAAIPPCPPKIHTGQGQHPGRRPRQLQKPQHKTQRYHFAVLLSSIVVAQFLTCAPIGLSPPMPSHAVVYRNPLPPGTYLTRDATVNISMINTITAAPTQNQKNSHQKQPNPKRIPMQINKVLRA